MRRTPILKGQLLVKKLKFKANLMLGYVKYSIHFDKGLTLNLDYFEKRCEVFGVFLFCFVLGFVLVIINLVTEDMYL